MIEKFKDVKNSEKKFLETTMLATMEFILSVGIDNAIELFREFDPEILNLFPKVKHQLHLEK